MGLLDRMFENKRPCLTYINTRCAIVANTPPSPPPPPPPPPNLVHMMQQPGQHYNSDVIMSSMASTVAGLSSICSTVSSGADQWKHQSSASLTFVRGIHRWLVDSPHKETVVFPFGDVIITSTVGSRSFTAMPILAARCKLGAISSGQEQTTNQ